MAVNQYSEDYAGTALIDAVRQNGSGESKWFFPAPWFSRAADALIWPR